MPPLYHDTNPDTGGLLIPVSGDVAGAIQPDPNNGALGFSSQFAQPMPVYRNNRGTGHIVGMPVGEYELRPQSGTNLTNFGTGWTPTGTVSHPAASETNGYAANLVNAGTANTIAGVETPVLFRVGTTVNGANGFWLLARVMFPDAGYNQSGAATGSRIFVGMAAAALATVLGSDNPNTARIGFQRHNVNAGQSDVNWQIVVHDGTTRTLIDTGLSFTTSLVYNLCLWLPELDASAANRSLKWAITSAFGGGNGSVALGGTTAFPAGATGLAAEVGLQSIDAVARNIRANLVHIETNA